VREKHKAFACCLKWVARESSRRQGCKRRRLSFNKG